MNKNLEKVKALIGDSNIVRINEVLQILGKKLPEDFDYEISYRVGNNSTGEWFRVGDWIDSLKDNVCYYINIGNTPNVLCYQNPSEYIKFHKDEKYPGIHVCISNDAYVYEWHKSLKTGNEQLLISESKNNNCIISFEKSDEGIYTSNMSIMGYNMSKINIIKSDILNAESVSGSRPIEEYYQCFTEEIDRMYNNGYLKKLLPTIINLENINIIKSIFKAPINNLVNSLDYNERMRRYNEAELSLYETKKNNIEKAWKYLAIHRKNYESQIDIINKEYKEKVKRLNKYLPKKENINS